MEHRIEKLELRYIDRKLENFSNLAQQLALQFSTLTYVLDKLLFNNVIVKVIRCNLSNTQRTDNSNLCVMFHCTIQVFIFLIFFK